MTRRTLVAVLGGSATLLLVVVVGCVGAAIRAVDNDPGDTPECRESVRAEEAKVRTNRWAPPEELPDLGDYPEIHWQVRSLSGEPCGRAPGPVDWAYQGVVRLRPADARTLAQRYGFAPYAPAVPAPQSGSPADAWPALAPFLPAAPRWLHSRAYDEATPSTRWRTAFLDVEHRTLFFTLQDH
ncbi:hypothetical protein ACGFNF_01460 [Micromonospora sp. NPDC048868]|uniref:hypothetical protein n=1 Tax=Micromonospora sp. NPDC048868 TaxID=3364258 RepID=UPI0037130B4D